ncbi:hypothetical protein L873DRAFT_1803803 [Choiromyces venosus 120613-1]|uniref:Uncharacterized protein n=1 Tax=Choiromyces venosus 120613-1 TaxID=1336337 RepID=A0A3N4JSI1_9PEZI|nr:hypothetical protein L873DRAFT_1803803 [Choiromyces venosus 120613-1]
MMQALYPIVPLIYNYALRVHSYLKDHSSRNCIKIQDSYFMREGRKELFGFLGT